MDEKSIKAIIQLVGLTEIESHIYIVLLDLGPSLANSLSRKAGIHRRSIYDALDRMIEKGLVSYIVKNGKRFYSATNPQRLKDIIEERSEKVDQILPILDAKFSESKEKQDTTFYKGKEGIKSVFDDQISTGKEVMIIGGGMNANAVLKYYFPHYDKARTKRKIKIKFLFNNEDRKEQHLKDIPLSETRFLPTAGSNLTSTCIYSDKVAIIVWSENPIAVLISNKSLAQSYTENFNLLWSISKT